MASSLFFFLVSFFLKTSFSDLCSSLKKPGFARPFALLSLYPRAFGRQTVFIPALPKRLKVLQEKCLIESVFSLLKNKPFGALQNW